MVGSSLATVKIPASTKNYTASRANHGKIEKITVHHVAGVISVENLGNIWVNPNRAGSSHYGIGNDGRVAQYVSESSVAWTDSNWQSNIKSVTIETSNSATGGQWPVGDKALASLIKLVADIAKRNGLGKLIKGQNLTWHSMYANTNCPGPYLMSKMDYIIAEANLINYPEVKTVNKWVKINDKTDGWLNVREGAGVSFKVVKKVNNGEVYHIVKEQGTWGQIENSGWIQLQLTDAATAPKDPEPTPAPTPAPEPVKPEPQPEPVEPTPVDPEPAPAQRELVFTYKAKESKTHRLFLNKDEVLEVYEEK